MKIRDDFLSPNFSNDEIPVKFVVVHYTACSLEKTMQIFMDRNRKVTSHFVIDTNGACFDLGGFFNGPILRGAHAGVSRLDVDGVHYEAFNSFSIGIELVNFNGNIWPFTDAQYASLTALTRHLFTRFPELKTPGRIIGHEQVAHFRGKCDPGLRFDWTRYLASVGAIEHALHGFHACTAEELRFIQERIRNQASCRIEDTSSQINRVLEERIRNRAARS